MKEKSRTILIIGKDPDTAKKMEMSLSSSGYIVLTTSEIEQAINLADNNFINIILMDTELFSSINFSAAVQKLLRKHNLPVVFIYSPENPDAIEKTRNITSYGYVMKNSADIVLLSAIQTALRLHELHLKGKEQIEEIEAANEELQAMMEELEAINNELITTQKNLADSEGKYRRLHESVMDAVIMIDMKGNLIETNNAFQTLLGYSGKELLGENYMAITPVEWRQFEKSIYKNQLFARGYSDVYEKEFIKKDGSRIPVEMRAYFFTDDSGNYVGVWAIVRDISERRKSAEALDKSEKILKSLLDATPIGVALLVGRTIHKINAATSHITGYTEEEVFGKSIRIVYPDDEEYIKSGEELYSQMYAEGLGTREIRVRKKDGSIIDVLTSIAPVDRNNPAAGVCATIMDITDRKRAEQALIKSENLLRNFLDEVMEGIAILDVEGTVTFWNNACTVMSGIPADYAMGKYWWDLAYMLEPEEMKNEARLLKLKSLFKKISGTGYIKYTKPVEVSIRRADGKEVLLERRIFPVKTTAGTQYAITILDITEKKYAEILKENALIELEKSEIRFRSIIQGSSDMIFILDRNGSFSYESPSVSEIAGYPPGYFIGKSPYTQIHPDDYKAVYNKINLMEQSIQTITPAEFRARKADGSWMFLEFLGNNQYENPSINGIVLTVRDISERKCSEIALRNSENLFKTLLNTTPAGVALLKERTFQKVNNALCNITGYTEDELIGKSTRILYFNDEEFNHVGEKLYDFKKENMAEMLESRLCKKDGTSIDALLSQSPFDIKDINSGVCTTILDITERNRFVTALRESEAELKSLLDSATIGIGMIRERRFIKVNKALSTITGYSEDELLNELTRKIYPSDEVYEKIGIELYESMKRNGVGIIETNFLTKDGQLRDIQLTLNPFDEKDLSIGQCATALDITERNRMEREIRESEEKFRSIYENMPLGFIRTQLDGSIIDINPAAVHMFGYSDRLEAMKLLGSNSIGLHLSVDERNNIIRDLEKQSGIKKYIVQMKKNDGSQITVSLIVKMVRLNDGEPAFLEGMLEDITERVKMQDILIQSEKMMTVAGLAAGMAHEINNPLGIIMQNAENAMHRLLDRLPGNIKAAEEAGITLEQLMVYVAQRRIDNYLDAIREAGGRAARIVSSMLQFSRMTESRYIYMNLNSLIDRALDLASNDFDLRKKYDFKKITITKNYGELPDIPCVETQIEQVLLNIFKNSAHAMSQIKKEGMRIPEIIITTMKEDNAVRLELQDNGPGMDEATRKRVFEPFFTTKQTGTGTGLGLSVSYYIIVNGHKGTIWIDSAPGTGTKIVITLPLSKKDNKNGQAYPSH